MAGEPSIASETTSFRTSAGWVTVVGSEGYENGRRKIERRGVGKCVDVLVLVTCTLAFTRRAVSDGASGGNTTVPKLRNLPEQQYTSKRVL